jgi:hypothetical protein
MMRLLRITLLLGAILAMPICANAASWIFQRGYYSHDPVTKARIGPQVSGGPYYSPVRGEFTRTGFRHIRSQINVGGIYDQYNEWDTWIQSGSQF